jgi:anti-anti-sigma regulatory factor
VISEEPLSTSVIVATFSNDVTATEIQQFTTSIVSSSYKTVIIDLSEMSHINHAILSKLYMLKLDLTVSSKQLTFQGCSERLIDMLKMLKFDKTIEILKLSPQKEQNGEKRPHRDKE